MKKYTILIFLFSTQFVFGMEEVPEESITLKQAQENAATKQYPYALSEQLHLLNLAKGLDRMSKEEAQQFVNAIKNPEYQTILKEICCLQYGVYKTNEINKTPKQVISYTASITCNKNGLYEIVIKHPEIIQPLFATPIGTMAGEIRKQYNNQIAVAIPLEWCNKGEEKLLIWHIPTFEEYLSKRPEKTKVSPFEHLINRVLNALIAAGT